MEDFKTKYLSRCSELSISPVTELLNIFNRIEDETDPLKETLNMSGVSLPLKACTALASALSDNSFFTRIVLSDAFLGDDGCIKLANALKTNSTLLSLDLRGNSIRSEGAVALANLLKVNSKLQHLFLEWNCLGIWDSGMKCISDALSINESLQTLDLRNNKIGPQSAQHLALCIKHNHSLRKIDLRWNNCGIIGGRSFVDLLQWNQVLVELDIIGNEIPEDTNRSIAAALERNRTKFQQSINSHAHSEAMTSTIQSLTTSHHEALLILQQKYSKESQNSDSLQDQLSIASSEIQSMQQAYKNSQTKAEILEQECKRLEDLLIKERTEIHEKLNDRQRDLSNERENRKQAEIVYQKQLTDQNDRLLSMDSKIRKTAMDLEVLTKDKNLLQEDLNLAKEKERKLIQFWEEKIERLHITNQNKLGEVSDLKDREYAGKIKRFEEKIRNIESDLARAQEENLAQKARHLIERNRLVDQENEVAVHIRKEEGIRYSELETKCKFISNQNESLQDELAGNLKRFSVQRKDFESEIKRLCDDKMLFQNKISDLQSQGMKHALELNILKSKLDEAKKYESELNLLQTENTKISEKNSKHVQEIERLQFMLTQRDSSVLRLRDELKRRDLELDAKDEETALQMKELQLSINGLLVARAKSRIRTSADLIV